MTNNEIHQDCPALQNEESESSDHVENKCEYQVADVVIAAKLGT